MTESFPKEHYTDPAEEDHSLHLLSPLAMERVLDRTRQYLPQILEDEIYQPEGYDNDDMRVAKEYARKALSIIEHRLSLGDPTAITFEDIVEQIQNEEQSYQGSPLEKPLTEQEALFLRLEKSMQGYGSIEENKVPGDCGIDLFRDAFAAVALQMALDRSWYGVPAPS